MATFDSGRRTSAVAPASLGSGRPTAEVQTSQGDSASTDLPALPVVQAPAGSCSVTKFHWSQVESTNYLTYISNLRGIGCPESTIRDIVTAELSAFYQERRRALASGSETRFWRAEYGRGPLGGAEVEALRSEEREVAKFLLGEAVVNSNNEADPVVAQLNLESLSPEQGQRIVAWNQKFESARSALLEITATRDLTDEENAQLAVLEAARSRELDEMLSPAERFEFELRNSPSAELVRRQAARCELTEEQFRAVVQARLDFDQELATPASEVQITQALRIYDDSLRQVLDQETFQKFQVEDQAGPL